jgi:hypothetical protein
VRRLFEVNSEPDTGARPSVRLCVGLITSDKAFGSRELPVKVGRPAGFKKACPSVGEITAPD